MGVIATALTGLRLGELLALTREDVDLPGRRLNAHSLNRRAPGYTSLGFPGA